tara:strand:+ start:137 stop:667 length:531 start_codon:yes stop_codon:yes gene_type:complete
MFAVSTNITTQFATQKVSSSSSSVRSTRKSCHQKKIVTHITKAAFKTTKSEKIFEEAQDLLPGGVNSPVRAFKSVGGQPIVFDKVKGACALYKLFLFFDWILSKTPLSQSKNREKKISDFFSFLCWYKFFVCSSSLCFCVLQQQQQKTTTTTKTCTKKIDDSPLTVFIFFSSPMYY